VRVVRMVRMVHAIARSDPTGAGHTRRAAVLCGRVPHGVRRAAHAIGGVPQAWAPTAREAASSHALHGAADPARVPRLAILYYTSRAYVGD